MRATYIFQFSAFLAASYVAADFVTGELGNATVVENNPLGAKAVGTLPDKPFFQSGSLEHNVKGSITVKSSGDGIGVVYTVKFSDLPQEGGPFLYHVHTNVVPDDGNCTSTLAHLDPFVRGETPACNSTFPQSCQVGDLSGKYGKITSDPFEATFTDEFSSMNVGSNASIPDRSFVVHFANTTRITCANFVLSGSGSTTNTSTGTSPNATAPVVVVGGGSSLNVGALLQTMAFFGAFLILI
ncbi:superoxide dismutase [Xylariales sp. PMI_506]|nr:superoxide dismutase [Xylariales sp. PMI_506]